MQKLTANDGKRNFGGLLLSTQREPVKQQKQ